MKKITKDQAMALGGGAVGAGLIWKIFRRKFGKKQRKIIGVDFDGTICRDNFPDVGEPEDGVKEAFERILKKYDIVVHSCRTAKYWKNIFKDHKPEEHEKIIKNFMETHEIPYTKIETVLDKPVYYKYVGDEAIQYNKYVNWKEIADEVLGE